MMLRGLSAIAFILLLLAPPVKAPVVTSYPATLVRVIDGDTVKLAIAPWAGTPFHQMDVRISGIDTPESRKPPAKCITEVKRGKLATAFARTLAHGRDLILPDLALTPGVATDLSTEEICSRAWGKDRRHVTAAMKREVFRRYGLKGNKDRACKPDAHGRRCELDHLVSRELGGADDVDNIWPQPYGGKPWNAVRKDRVENRLHKEVCAGNITLEQAQEEIRDDYRIPYRRYFGEPTKPKRASKRKL